MSPRLVALLLAATLTTPVGAANLFCCQDSGSGRRVCGDVLPSQCRGLAYKIIDGQGNVVREVAAPLNAEQRAQKESAERKRKEYEEMQREQRRRDAALLDLYNRPEDIDKARTRAEDKRRYLDMLSGRASVGVHPAAATAGKSPASRQ